MKKMMMQKMALLGLVAMIGASLAFGGCSVAAEAASAAASNAIDVVAEKSEGAADKAESLAETGGEIAGAGAASFIGSTAAGIGKSFNKQVVERLEYLEISVNDVDEEKTPDGTVFAIELTIKNSAPANEKLYVDVLLDGDYLLACDQDDYVYTLSTYGLDGYTGNQGLNYIPTGKSRLTVYTTMSGNNTFDHLLFLGEDIGD